MKPFIKWEGSKYKHTRHIYSHIPKNYNTYIEPFIGGGAMFLKVKPTNWIINDINCDLVTLWKLMQSDVSYVVRKIKTFSKKFNNKNKEEKLLYCQNITSKLNNQQPSNQRSINFLLMKSLVFMGYIFVKDKFNFSSFNFGNDKDEYPSESYYNRLLKINSFLNSNNEDNKIMCQDYKQVLKLAKKGDFVFLDPPYIEEHDYQFKYNKDGKYDGKFLSVLLKELNKLDKRGVKWLMTQADTHAIRSTFEKYTIIEYPVYRSIRKMYINELVIKNY